MQLDRLITFHKTLGDKTRLRIIALLHSGPLHGQAIAGKLALTPATISHHLTKLRDCGLVYERRDKNTIYYHLDQKKLLQMSQAVIKMGDETMDKQLVTVEEKNKVLQNFFTSDGKIKTLPAQRKKKLIILDYLARKLEKGRLYEEKELNEFIKQFHEDFATIRREFIMCYFMTRENNKYELNPEEMWKVGFSN